MDELVQIDALIEMAETMLETLRGLKRNAEPPISGKVIAVPWLSQLGPTASYAPGDCGAACVAMLANWRGQAVTVDNVGKAIGKAPGYGSLNFNELIAGAAHYGITLKHDTPYLEQIREDIDRDKPVIVLLNYRSIPMYDRYSASYNAGHYVLVVGYAEGCITYHDPYWPQHDRGEYKQMTNADFGRAYTTIAPGNSLAKHALRIV